MKSETKERLNFHDFISRMDVLQFHAFCGMLWDEKNASKRKWDLWEGVRGYPGQAEILEAFSTEKFNWLLKARQIGGSESAGFVANFESFRKKNHETIVISSDLPEAKYFLKRRVLQQLKSMVELEYEPGKRFPWPKYKDNSDTGKILYETGSFTEALSSDNESGRSRSSSLVVFDEIRSYSNKDADELWGGLEPIVSRNPVGRLIALSSAKFGSWANETTQAIMDGKMSGIRFLFMPADTDPGHTPEFRAEAIQRAKVRALYIQEHPLEPDDCFKGREGAVFDNFDDKRGGKHVNHVELNWAYRYCIVYDHGIRHPAVMLFCLYNPYTDHLYVFDEVFCRGLKLPEVCFAIKEKLRFYSQHHHAPPPNVKLGDRAIFNEDGRKSVAEEIRDYTGLNLRASKKYTNKNEKMAVLTRVLSRFTMGKITIDPRCENTIKQIKELKYITETAEKKRDDYVDVEDDAIDDLMYLEMELTHGGSGVRPDSEPLAVVLDRKHRVRELAKSALTQGSDALGGESWLNL